MKKLLLILGALVALTSLARAQTPGLRANGLRLTTQTSVPGTASASGPMLWADTTTIPVLRFNDGTNANRIVGCVPTTTGDVCTWNSVTGNWQRSASSGGTLATTYAAGASQADSTFTLDSTRLGLRILDAASPINGIMFNVANNAATTSYFFISDNAGQLIKSAAASGSNNFTVDTVSSYTSGTLARFSTGGTQVYGFGPFGLTLAQPAATSGTPTMVSLTGAASTGLTTATEVPDVDFNIARTVTWATGALATQRFVRLRAPTIAFAGASTVTNAYNLAVEGAPKAGTNATLTSSSAVGIFTGADAGIGLTLVPNSATQTGAMWRSLDASGNVLASLTMTDSGASNKLSLTSQLNGGYVFLEAMSNAGANDLKFQLNGGTLQLFGGNGVYQFLNGAASVTELQIDTNGVHAQHYGGSGTAPTKAAGACIGGTQTVTLDANATDTAGTLTLTGTGTGTASSTCVTVTFNLAYSNAPHCQIAPVNAAASALSGTGALYLDNASTTTAVFVIKSGSTALPAGTYLYNYDCTQ